MVVVEQTTICEYHNNNNNNNNNSSGFIMSLVNSPNIKKGNLFRKLIV